MTKDSQVQKLLLNYKNWATLGKKEIPFHFEIYNTDQTLYYFGSNHSRNPKDPQYIQLKDYWTDFISKVKPEKAFVLIEGGLRKLRNTAEESIMYGSEAGYMTYEAAKLDVLVESPEPDKSSVVNTLLSKFTKNEIAYYYFARMVLQWHRLLDPKPDFEHYIFESLKKEREFTILTDFEFNLANMEKIHKVIFNTPLEKEDMRFFENNTISIKNNSVINEVARLTNVLRDVHIISRIENLWKEGKSIFAVFGGVHPIMQENIIRESLNIV